MSESSIATVVLKRRKQISGIVSRSQYSNRSAMTLEQRQAALDQLFTVRYDEDGQPIDGGILDRVPREVMALRPKQTKSRGE